MPRVLDRLSDPVEPTSPLGSAILSDPPENTSPIGALPLLHAFVCTPCGEFVLVERQPALPDFTQTTQQLTIIGLTLDSGGIPLASCIVQLFRTGDDSIVAETTSDGSGNYSFTVSNGAGTFYVVAYKAGAPDVFGTTANTLTVS